MRLFPAVKYFSVFFLIGGGVLLSPSPVSAQSPAQISEIMRQARQSDAQKIAAQQQAISEMGSSIQAREQDRYAAQAADYNTLYQDRLRAAGVLPGAAGATGANPYNPFGTPGAPGAPPPEDTSARDIDDPESPLYKADRLAKKSAQQRDAMSTLEQKEDVTSEAPPPEIDTLQKINEFQSGASGVLADDPINKEISLDMRKSAQKEAALSYGARGGLAKRNYQIMERMKGFDPVLDKVFDFRSLLIKAPSGMMIEPPIVKESLNALVITEEGNEAAVADDVYDINKQAKIVSAPRDWRQYLLQFWSDVPPPPRILWPKTPAEQASWSTWVAEGWKAGLEQAEQIFEMNTNRLVADYRGMVRYRMLLAQGMISEPYALHEDRGVTGGKNQMRVGDRALRITGPSQFLTGAELWKPADR